MKIGITEAGDASRDYTWVQKEPEMDMMVLITKHVTDEFIQEALKVSHKTIVHATCTGYGGTVLEPNVPKWEVQLEQVRKLIAYGFPAEQVVIRIDPIIPTVKGLGLVEAIVENIHRDVKRFRISVLDNYKHVQTRFKAANLPVLYNGEYQASDEDFLQLDLLLSRLKFRFGDIRFESCAEPKLKKAEPLGCVCKQDMELFGLKTEDTSRKKKRVGCLCEPGKVEMLPFTHYYYCTKHEAETEREGACQYGDCCKDCEHVETYGCENKCLYCYWKT